MDLTLGLCIMYKPGFRSLSFILNNHYVLSVCSVDNLYIIFLFKKHFLAFEFVDSLYEAISFFFTLCPLYTVF